MFPVQAYKHTLNFERNAISLPTYKSYYSHIVDIQKKVKIVSRFTRIFMTLVSKVEYKLHIINYV